MQSQEVSILCGIAGILDLKGGRVDEADLVRMIAPVRHRGPDATGTWTSGCVGLAHARLSIIDVEGGVQPMTAVEGRVAITFNGEIYNYIELREELRTKGHEFRTRSDTEVLLRSYLEWGEDCVRRFNGQWAFAIWDGRKDKLFCSRDRLGIRPLFYTVCGGRFLFASEIKSLFADPAVPREVDPRGLDHLLTFWTIVPPRTFYMGISQLPPGCSLTVEHGKVGVRRYWELDFPGPASTASEEELAGRLLDLLVDSVRIRLRSDVPVGAYLSGGLDSSVITGILKRRTDTRLSTFSVTFEDGEFDEGPFQSRVIDYLDVDHSRTLCRATDIGRVFPEMIWHAEQPTVRTAPAPLFMLSGLVREKGYKVVLTGEGSDEVLGGYDIFKETLVRKRLAENPDDDEAAAMLRGLYPWMPGLQAQPIEWLRGFFHAAPEDLNDPFFSHLPRWDLTSGIKRFYSDGMKSRIGGNDARADMMEALPDAYSGWDTLGRAQFLEAGHLMPGYILSSQGDRMAMAHSVEGRFPFLDHRLVEFASTLPPDLKVRGMDEKYLLKKAAGDLVPEFLRTRPKQPYRAPESPCFFAPENGKARFPWVDEVLSADAIGRAGLFNPAAVALLKKKATAGKITGARDGMALTAILSTQLAAIQFVENNAPSG